MSAPPSISPATEAIIDTSSSSAGVSGGRIVGSRAASIDLPAPGGPIISRLWPPAAATSSARLALSWPLMSREVEQRAVDLADLRLRARQHLRALEMVGELDQRGGAMISISGLAQAASGAAGRRADQAFAARIGADRGRQHAGDRGDRAVEAELAQHGEARERVAGCAPIAAIRPSAIGRS